MRTDLLEEAMRTGPKFLYALPNFQNPTGVTLSEERRRRIIELADHYGVPIVEDDPYGQLRFEGEHLTPLFVLDSRTRAMQQDGSNVVYLSTFSKTLAPGIRLGWIVAPAEVIQKLVTAKQGTDLHTSTLVQMVAHEISRGGFLDKHAHQVRSVYKARRDTILAALDRNMPEGVHWTRPLGGLFTWVTLPGRIDAADLLREAVEEGVAFVPGAAFHADGSGRNTMRLNFSYAPPELIEEGIRRLGGVLKRQLAAVACLQA